MLTTPTFEGTVTKQTHLLVTWCGEVGKQSKTLEVFVLTVFIHSSSAALSYKGSRGSSLSQLTAAEGKVHPGRDHRRTDNYIRSHMGNFTVTVDLPNRNPYRQEEEHADPAQKVPSWESNPSCCEATVLTAVLPFKLFCKHNDTVTITVFIIVC